MSRNAASTSGRSLKGKLLLACFDEDFLVVFFFDLLAILFLSSVTLRLLYVKCNVLRNVIYDVTPALPPDTALPRVFAQKNAHDD